MAQFKYTLPSGAEFTLQAPVDTTQEQADRIFYEQVAAGSFVGYQTGQSLSSIGSKVTAFELSRIDRGTAGVTSVPIVAINQGLSSTQDGISTNPSLLASIQALPVIAAFPNLSTVSVTDPVDQADIILAKGDSLGPNPVGPLTGFEIQTLQAQIINLVNQDDSVITQEKGIGKYGLTCYQLEQAGYVKPGTFDTYLVGNPDDFIAVMNTPSIWTGLDGVTGLDNILSDSELQNRIQNQLMQQGYDGLLAAGIVAPPQASAVSLSTGTVYTQSGLQTLSALSLLGASTQNFGSSLSGASLAANPTLNRLLSTSITNLSTLNTGAIANTLTDVNFANLAANIGKNVTGNLGALVTNASKFTPEITGLWSTAGAGLKNLANLPALSVNQLKATLTNVTPLNASSIDGALNTFGKASQYGLSFSNPSTALGNLSNLGNLNGAVTALKGQSQAAVGQAQALAGQLQGNLSNLGDIGKLFGGSGDLVSGTQIAGGFTNTVNRKTVDAAVSRILGSNKITVPNFEYPSAASVADKLDIAQAQSILGGGQVFGQTVTI